jgi:TonB family protein
MENFDVDVRTGTETHLNTAASPFAGYIHALHNRIRPRWSSYLLWLDRSYGPGSVLADPNLAVTLEYVIHSDGTVANVQIVRTSGEGIFDGEAVNMLWEIGPHAVPPDDMLSYDGKARIHWQFHRDQRMCGTFGASVRFIQEPN